MAAKMKRCLDEFIAAHPGGCARACPVHVAAIHRLRYLPSGKRRITIGMDHAYIQVNAHTCRR
jgi:hypothetical protein